MTHAIPNFLFFKLSLTNVKIYRNGTCYKFHQKVSSKEMGFYNPRSQLDSTPMTYCPMQLKNGEDR